MSEHASLSRYTRIGAFLLRYRKAGRFDELDLDVQDATLAELPAPSGPPWCSGPR
ncbi:MAG: hypothetical protein ABI178_07155 [Rhodanobacter sp.]